MLIGTLAGVLAIGTSHADGFGTTPPDQLRAILDQIERAGGSVEGPAVQPPDRTLYVSFETPTGPGGDIGEPSPAVVRRIEPGLRALHRLADDPSISLSLSLSGWSITDASLAHLAGLPSLCELELNETNVTDDGLSFLKNSERLCSIRLRDDRITGVGFLHLEDLPKFSSLALDGEPLTDEGTTAIGRLGRLQSLEVYDCRVTDAGLAKLRGLAQLRDLWLSGNAIQGKGLEALSGLRHLTRVTISEWLDAEGMASLGELKGLKSLILAYGPDISDADLAPLTNLQNLWSLRIDDPLGPGNNGIGDEGMVHVGALVHLHHLELYSRRITDAGLARLADLENLQSLRLHDTSVSPEGVRRLKERLTSLSVMLTFY
jgi:hypothetical protein